MVAKPRTVAHGRQPALHGMLLLLLAALGAMIAPSVAHANGRIISYERQTAGPYEIALGTIPESPSVGNLHLSLTVGALSSDAPVPVLDAVVTVVGSGPDALQTEIGPVAVGNSVREPRFYEANVGVDRVGVWTFDIMVASDLGEASATFEVRVQEISLLPGFLTLVVLVALLLILGLSVRSYLRQQRRGKRARAHWDEGRFSRKKGRVLIDGHATELDCSTYFSRRDAVHKAAR